MMRLFVILIGFFNGNIVAGLQIPSPVINVSKRIDVPSCTDRFDVHRDTIIQTEDSRKMGASFLYSVEVNNRDECLRLCCDTDRCDVFVFEEKYMGSCFLFQCGPPDDFRCQFASHANYSIAVLSPVQERYRDASSSALSRTSQHEQELISLKTGRESFGTVFRMPEMGNNNNNKVAAAPTTIGPIKTTTTTVSPSSACGRFQFRCHSGECIAIYNVCDGISQCEDGSDETPDCPSQKPSSNNNKAKSQIEESPLLYLGNTARANQHPQGRGGSNDDNLNPYPGRDRSQYPSKISDDNLVGNYNKGMTGAIERPPYRNREDPMTGPRYYPSAKQDSGPPLQIQYNINNDPKSDNRPGYDPINRLPPNGRDYYNPAGGGIRDKYYFPSQQVQPNQAIQPVIVPPQSAPAAMNYLPNNDGSNWPVSINNNRPPGPAAAVAVGNAAAAGGGGGNPLPPAQLPNGSPSPGNYNNNWPAVAAAPPPVVVVATKSKALAKPKAHRKENESDEEEEDGEEGDEDGEADAESAETTAPPRKGKSRGKHRKLEKAEKKAEDHGMPTFPPIYQQLKAIGSELDTEIFDHDGAADRPGGAIVSLVIGVSITAILAIFITCRMKTVGRRIRRKGPYAHDADFLVNGMYL